MNASFVKPRVLEATYPVYDSAGNRYQRIRVLFACGHEEGWLSLDIGRMGGYRWKPQTPAAIKREVLVTTCPIGYKLCRKCSEAPAA